MTGLGFDPDVEERLHDARQAIGNDDSPDLLAGLRTGEWLDAQTFPPIRWIIDGLIGEGFSLLVGPPKLGKSWLGLDLALAAAAGGRALGRLPIAEPRPVLLLALEDGDRRLQDRARRLLAGDPIPKRLHYLTRTEPGATLAAIDQWLTAYGEDRPLVILDTVGRVMPPALMGESAYGRDYRVGSSLKRLADRYPGTALVGVHHDRKASSDDFVDAVSGTNGLAGSADTILVLARARHSTDAVVKVTGRDVPESEYALKIVDGVWTLAGDTLADAANRAAGQRDRGQLGDRSADVLDLLRRHPDGLTPSQVDEILGLTDSRVVLKRLADSGRVVKPARGRYSLSRTPVTSVTSETFGVFDDD